MTERLECEFSLIRYVPDVVKGEFANIGVILRSEGAKGTSSVRFTRDWSRVKCIDPDADVELLEALEAEIADRLVSDAAAQQVRGNAKPILETLKDTLSNSVQLTPMRGTLAESLPAELEQLMKMYVEPLKAPSSRRRKGGRAAIAGQMRDAFEQAGVWRLMRKRIPAAQYTQAGDPLKIDCGYRPNGMVRLFHAVSLDSDAEGAKSVAYSAAALREGIARVEGAEVQLTAVVEPVAAVDDEEEYKFAVGAMEREAIRVMTTADLGRIAATARRELQV